MTILENSQPYQFPKNLSLALIQSTLSEQELYNSSPPSKTSA